MNAFCAFNEKFYDWVARLLSIRIAYANTFGTFDKRKRSHRNLCIVKDLRRQILILILIPILILKFPNRFETLSISFVEQMDCESSALDKEYQLRVDDGDDGL